MGRVYTCCVYMFVGDNVVFSCAPGGSFDCFVFSLSSEGGFLFSVLCLCFVYFLGISLSS